MKIPIWEPLEGFSPHTQESRAKRTAEKWDWSPDDIVNLLVHIQSTPNFSAFQLHESIKSPCCLIPFEQGFLLLEIEYILSKGDVESGFKRWE